MQTLFNRFKLPVLLLAASLLLTSCAGTAVAANNQPQAAQSQTTAVSDPAAVTYTLITAMKDGKMVYIGAGGEIDGQLNPDLTAQPGDVVEIILRNGDGMQHDLTLEGLNAATPKEAERGKEVTVKFKVDQAGAYAYFCSVPGHRQAGMEGQLIVGQPAPVAETNAPSIARAADDLPGPLNRSASEPVRVDLETTEVQARLADGVTYTFWTFNGQVPGPFIRVRAGDIVEVHLKNSISSTMAHSVDFHAVTGPGGGAVATQTQPGGETMFTFKALNPGLYVYHCATPMVAHHITNGMYGLILVEPEGGLPAVDREFYVMQGELYTEQPLGDKGAHTFDQHKLLDEDPEYFVLNGSVGSLTAENPLKANVGETVRIFFGVGGPNFTSSFHVIGEIFDRVYDQGSLTSAPLTDVQTTTVAPGGATVVEFAVQVPGRYILVDHALSRMERGLAGYLIVDGQPAPDIYAGAETSGSGH